MLIERREGSVDPDYFQFYLRIGAGEHAAADVSSTGYEIHLEATTPRFVYVGTEKKFKPTPVTVEVHDREPELPHEAWQHVVEVSLTGGGAIEVLSWGSNDPTMNVPVPVGPLRLRAMWTGLVPGLAEGLPEDGNSDERLMFQLWPAPTAERSVLRWWSEWELPAPTPMAPDGRRQIEGLEEVVIKLRSLRVVPIAFPYRPGGTPPPPMPGGSGACSGVWGDPADGSWWVDGYAARRTLRVASEDEVRALVRQSEPLPTLWQMPTDPGWIEMLRSIGVDSS
jgi:hypothetical protein